MAESLVIVESPAKAKTIEKFLGSKYKVVASQGHIRDLPKSKLGVDVEHGFEPSYIALRGRKEVLETIRKEAKKADKVYLATDPDREGEAISWHLAEVLKLDEKSKCRIEFNEITSAAVKGSFKKARPINMDLVDAQQARRVLDRLVGYKISPILWAKVRKGLSAGSSPWPPGSSATGRRRSTSSSPRSTGPSPPSSRGRRLLRRSSPTGAT